VILPDARLQLALDVLGVFVFALSGGLVAVQKQLDLFGVLVLAAVTGLGGGVLRDLLIGATPPTGVSDWRLVTPALLGGLVTFFWHPGIGRIWRFVRVLDAAGLGAFSVTGALKAVGLGATPQTAVIVGTLTAIGGGMLRDVLVGEVPEVLRRELYAVPAALGATAVVVGHQLGVLGTPVALGSALLVFALRVVAVLLDLNAPRPLRSGRPPGSDPGEDPTGAGPPPAAPGPPGAGRIST
jgi:uncharacterized membrane protein YeiH